MTDFVADGGEVLETGYRDSTPRGDNLLLDFARAHADCFAGLVGAGGGAGATGRDRDAHLQ